MRTFFKQSMNMLGRFFLFVVTYGTITFVFVFFCLGFGSLITLSFKQHQIPKKAVSDKKNCTNCKYILLWTRNDDIPFVYLKEGQTVFIENNCSYTNCYVTAEQDFLGFYTKFDAIAFDSKLVSKYSDWLPRKRKPYQKYVFTSIESPDHYPICNTKFNNYFNWTWTYLLDSDSRWGYIAIRDMNNKLIGPNKDMNWIKLEDMNPVSEVLKSKLSRKNKVAAWFVSNCKSTNKREEYVQQLQLELAKYGYSVDIFGKCGSLNCSRDGQLICDKMIKDNYYFYLAFENSFSEDYVTEKVLTPLLNNAVPIVYGGANYTRFMADGMYLNARELGAEYLAKKMHELIRNPDAYHNYFRWQNHYRYSHRNSNNETNDYCGFCASLNNEDKVRRHSAYKNFTGWWLSPGHCVHGRLSNLHIESPSSDEYDKVSRYIRL